MGYWPSCCMQVCLGVMAATGPRFAWCYWHGCCRPMLAWAFWPGFYRPQVGLWVLAWLLQPTGGSGLAATALRIAWGYWPGCYRLQVGLTGTGLAAAAHRGYWPCCYSPQDSLGVLAWLLEAPGWPGVTGLVLAWLLQPTGGTGPAFTGPRLT